MGKWYHREYGKEQRSSWGLFDPQQCLGRAGAAAMTNRTGVM